MIIKVNALENSNIKKMMNLRLGIEIFINRYLSKNSITKDFNPFKHFYYHSFTKTPGLRSLEMKLESCKHLIRIEAGCKIKFKILPLFADQKLDIKNCMLEFEYFSKAIR